MTTGIDCVRPIAALDELSAAALHEASAACIDADPEAALLWHRIAHLLDKVAGEQKVRFHSFLSEVCAAPRWAERNNYQAWACSAGRPFQPGPLLSAAAGPWAVARNAVTRQYDTQPHLVRATDASVMLHRWPNGEELLLPFGRDWSLLWGDPFWLRYYPFVRRVDAANRNVIFEFDRRQAERKDGAFFFLDGRSNWTHWIVDFLSNIAFLDAAPELRKTTIVTTRLKDWQWETLRHFGVADNVLQLDCPPDSQATTTFSDMFFGAGLPLPERLRYLRNRLVQPTSGLRRRVYLSRANLAPRHRVQNEEEAQALLRARGFEILYGDHMTLQDKISVFSNAEIVAFPPGSSTTNFIAFCPEQTIGICFLPYFLNSDAAPVNWVLGGSTYSVDSFERTLFVVGREQGAPPPTIDIDAPLHYPASSIVRAVDVAEAALKGRAISASEQFS